MADACVIEGYPTTNLGDTIDMWAGYDDYLSPDGKIVRSLIKFDVPIQIQQLHHSRSWICSAFRRIKAQAQWTGTRLCSDDGSAEVNLSAVG